MMNGCATIDYINAGKIGSRELIFFNPMDWRTP